MTLTCDHANENGLHLQPLPACLAPTGADRTKFGFALPQSGDAVVITGGYVMFLSVVPGADPVTEVNSSVWGAPMSSRGCGAAEWRNVIPCTPSALLDEEATPEMQAVWDLLIELANQSEAAPQVNYLRPMTRPVEEHRASLCLTEPAPAAPDRHARQVAEQVLRAMEIDLHEDADPVGQIEEHIRTIIAARRKPRRPDFDEVRHICLTALLAQMTAEACWHSKLFAPCAAPLRCRLDYGVRTLLPGFELATRRFCMGMAATRISIWPLS